MNNNRRRIQWDIPTEDPSIVVSTCVWHCSQTKAYWCTVTPVELDGIFRTTVCYSGFKERLSTATRFSRKNLEELTTLVKDSTHWNDIQSLVADSKGLSLSTTK